MNYPQLDNMVPTPLVSVILPVYNREAFLRQTLDSLVVQSYKSFEVIVINDGSNDSSVGIIEEYLKGYPQLFSLFSQDNRGVSSARNLGISKARGEFIAFLDSDDLWIRDKLQVQLDYMLKHKCSICQTDEAWVRNGKKVNHMKKHTKRSGKIFIDSLPLCIVSPSAVMIKKEVFQQVGGFNEALPVAEDYDLWLRISLIYPIYFIKQKLIIKTGGHADQLSRKYWGMDRFRLKALLNISKSKKLNFFNRNAVSWYIQQKSWILFNGSFKRGKLLAGIKYLFYYLKFRIAWLNA